MTPDQLNRITAQVLVDLEDATGPLAERYERLLRGAGRHMARRLRAQAVSLTAAAGMLPPDEDEVIPQNLQDKVDKVTAEERSKLVKALVAAYEATDVAFDVAPTLSPELLEKVGAHATFALDAELRDIYRGVIENAAQQGLSIPHTARDIVAAVDGAAGGRATALARTDMIGLANGASQAIATDAFAGREDVLKVWLATDDDRTRDTHVDANGQEVTLNEHFDVGGYPLLYPGDPDGPDEEVINCRCTQVYSGEGGGGAAEEEELVASGGWVSVTPATYSAPVTNSEEATMSTVTVNVNGEEQPVTEERARTPWEGILAIEGSPTSDGRYLLPGEVGNRDLPLPIAGSHDDMHATETVGRIEDIEHIPAAEFEKEGWELPDDLPPQAVVIWGEGTFDGSEESEDAIRQMENGVGISIDLPMERQTLIDPETYEEVDPATVINDDNLLDVLFGGVPDGYLRGIAGKIAGASLASIAAFEETVIRIVEQDAVVASGFAIRERESVVPLVVRVRDSVLTDVADHQWLVASVAPLMPRRAAFFREEADEPTPITILPDGEFYGHLALWNVCHAGKANGAYSACMFAPHSRTNYSQFHLGSMLCDDGSEVPVGRLTIGTGHAPLHLKAAATRKHYDNSGTVVAFARAKDGVFGIWLSGILKSDATPEQVRDFRACPPSGDWRNHDGALELQAALAVNVPAFPVARGQLALAASAEDMEVATLILGPLNDDDFVEALRVEYAIQQHESVDMLVELSDT